MLNKLIKIIKIKKHVEMLNKQIIVLLIIARGIALVSLNGRN